MSLDRAIREHVERRMREAAGVAQIAIVIAVDPLQVELVESGIVLDDTQLILRQDVVAYDRDVGIDRKDTVTLLRQHSGEEILWYVTGVTSDKEPARASSSGTGFPTDPRLGEIFVKTSTTPNEAYIYTGDGDHSGWAQFTLS